MTSSNIADVIDSVRDVRADLRYEFNKRIDGRVDSLQSEARQLVYQDANYTGKLAQNIETFNKTRGARYDIGIKVSLEKVPYAAIVEYGSGDRTNDPWKHSASEGLQTRTAYKFGVPFDPPTDIEFNKDNPYDVGDYPTFSAFVGHIENWMERKGITPESGDMYTSAVGIAAAIIEHGNYAHPYLRPAWFKMEPQIRRAAKNALRAATR